MVLYRFQAYVGFFCLNHVGPLLTPHICYRISVLGNCSYISMARCWPVHAHGDPEKLGGGGQFTCRKLV